MTYGAGIWTPERVETASAMWAKGFSASEIAERIGATRNSVLGYAHRNRAQFPEQREPRVVWTPKESDELLTLYDKGLTQRQAAKKMGRSHSDVARRLKTLAADLDQRRRNKQPLSNAEKARIAAHKEAQRARQRLRADAAATPAPEFLCVSLVDLAPNGCKWPLGDPKLPGFGYCGLDRGEERSYCSYHSLKAYQPKQASEKAR